MRFLAVNQTAVDKYGYTREEFSSLTVVDMQVAEDRPQVIRQIRNRDAGAIARYSRRHVTKGGQIIEAEVTAQPFMFGDRPARIILVNDVTEKLRAERALQESEQRYRDLFELNPSPMWVYDFETLAILAVNEAAVRNYGYTREDFAALTVPDMHPPEDVPEMLGRIRQRDPNVMNVRQVRHCRKDGSILDVEVKSGPISFGGRMARLVLANDITGRKRAEIERARLAAIVENTDDAIISRTVDGTLLTWNKGAEEIFGYTAEEVVGQNVIRLAPPEFQDNSARNAEQLLRGEVVPPFETVRLAKDGRRVDVQISVSAIRDAGGNVTAIASIFRDISERKRAEAALRESEERFRAAFEQAAVGMALRDVDPHHPRWLRVNQKLCEILGYTQEELLQMTTIEVTPPEDRDESIEYGRRLRQGEIRGYSREKRYVRKDGQIIWVNLSLSAVRGPDGKPTHMVSIVQDITDRKQTEERLKQANRARRVLADCSHALVQASSEAELLQEMCRIVVESGGYVQAWIGYAGEDEGKSVVPVGSAGFEPGYLESKTMSWAEDGRYPSLTGRIIATGRLYISRDILSDPNARHLVERAQRREYRSMIGLPLLLEGKCIGGISIYAKEADAFGDEEVALLTTLAEDIAFGIKGLRTRIAHSEAEKALLRERALLRAVIDNLPDFIYAKDRDRRFLLANPAWFRVRGAGNYAGITGKTVFDYFPKNQAEQLDNEDKTIIETGTPVVNREFVAAGAGERQEWYLTTKVPLRDPDGSISGVLGITRDITEIRQSAEVIKRLNMELEQRVIERTAQLEAANKELESFAYSVSHDLRAPLRSIDGFSQSLLKDYRDKLDANGRDYLGRVRNASQRMAALIDDLLSLSRITRGEIRRESASLSALAREIVADIRKEQPGREISIEVGRGIKVQADPNLLRIALDNLLRNAWKFTARQPDAKIEVGVEQKAGRPVYFVRDNGVGFDMKYAGKLFGAFQRLHSDADFPGTGIGLAIVQRVIRRHGGEIWVEAAVGKGAAFFFTFGNEMKQ